MTMRVGSKENTRPKCHVPIKTSCVENRFATPQSVPISCSRDGIIREFGPSRLS